MTIQVLLHVLSLSPYLELFFGTVQSSFCSDVLVLRLCTHINDIVNLGFLFKHPIKFLKNNCRMLKPQ